MPIGEGVPMGGSYELGPFPKTPLFFPTPSLRVLLWVFSKLNGVFGGEKGVQEGDRELFVSEQGCQ